MYMYLIIKRYLYGICRSVNDHIEKDANDHNLITVQHGSADTVGRAVNVKYRKWRLGVL